jgi:hypothetical protein
MIMSSRRVTCRDDQPLKAWLSLALISRSSKLPSGPGTNVTSESCDAAIPRIWLYSPGICGDAVPFGLAGSAGRVGVSPVRPVVAAGGLLAVGSLLYA